MTLQAEMNSFSCVSVKSDTNAVVRDVPGACPECVPITTILSLIFIRSGNEIV